MAVGIGNGNGLKRTASLPSTTAFTACGWAKRITASATDYQFIFGFDNTSPQWLLMGWENGAGGAFHIEKNGSEPLFSSGPALNTWFFWAMYSDAGNCYGRWANRGDTTFQTVSMGSFGFTPTTMWLGTDVSNEYIDGNLAHVKIWNAALTDNELLQEMYSGIPRRTANLYLWCPLWTNSMLNDLSGNGNSLTAVGTPTTQDMPPVTWSSLVQMPQQGVGVAVANSLLYARRTWRGYR